MRGLAQTAHQIEAHDLAARIHRDSLELIDVRGLFEREWDKSSWKAGSLFELTSLGRLEEAETYLKEGLEIAETIDRKKDRSRVRALSGLAFLALEQDRLDEA